MVKAKKSSPENSKPKAVSTEKNPGPDPVLFPVVGIGASAGGLEAMEQFFKHVPVDSGRAYIVVQHLDPTHTGMLPELLQRITHMEVAQAKDNMTVHPNHVYVIPPDKSMSISNGKLSLFTPLEKRGLRLPIDFFLKSLAMDCNERSIALILSGMGSDGSAGVKAIKENNGTVLVQDPDSAKFDSMPRSAIESVLVDIVAPPQELSEKLTQFLQHFPLAISDLPEINDQTALEKIINLLRNYTGNDFSQYKKSTLSRRIERRMAVHHNKKIDDYVTLLKKNPKEGEILFKELMIGVTSFFRDAKVWKKLNQEVIPAYLNNHSSNGVLRAWVAGCSTGEEAYSLAIAFKDALDKIQPARKISLQIFATDLDNDAIATARKGFYPVNIEADIDPQHLERYFVKSDEGYRVTSPIREMVVFAQHNLLMHPPFINIDFLSCRNLLIYLEADLQKKILSLFYHSLKKEGVMVLGSSESVGGPLDHLFDSIDRTLKIFKRNTDALAPELLNFPSSFSRSKLVVNHKPAKVAAGDNIQTLADQLILQQFSPPGVLVTENGDILYISGRTGKYLEPAAGKANLNIFSMLREGLRQDFHSAFRRVISTKGLEIIHKLRVGTNGTSQTLNISIQYINKPEPLRGTYMIIFNDLPEIIDFKPMAANQKSKKNIREAELESELQAIREEMQTTQEEMQTSQEELKTTNEELQAANEELQSANEELTSSKEEMQSLNEELQTLNAELMEKVEHYTRIDNDMKNLLNSTDIATLFLDKQLNIRQYTLQATKIFKLIKSDIGRPFTDLVSDITYPDMATDASKVLHTLVLIEKQIPGKDGKWFSIRLMPYRTFDNRVDGLVITFIDITQLKQMEAKYLAAKK
jgi:two-component system, chemotaxis family, CheB/CheR fusion protein